MIWNKNVTDFISTFRSKKIKKIWINIQFRQPTHKLYQLNILIRQKKKTRHKFNLTINIFVFIYHCKFATNILSNWTCPIPFSILWRCYISCTICFWIHIYLVVCYQKHLLLLLLFKINNNNNKISTYKHLSLSIFRFLTKWASINMLNVLFDGRESTNTHTLSVNWSKQKRDLY